MDLETKVKEVINSDLTATQKAIKLTGLVQSIPYARIGSLDPDDMIKAGKGSCTPKHIFLARLFKEIGIPTKFLFIPFLYSKQKFPYTSDGKEVLEKMPVAYHVALKAFVNGSWRTIDATWEPQLEGFPHSNWNGDSDMELAVIPESTEEITTDPSSFEKKKVSEFTPEQVEARKKFYLYFDTVLDKSRKANKD